jgi:hypothetical protein
MYNEAAAKANTDRLRDSNFIKSCEAVNIPPTRRQASKYNNKRGLVYEYERKARVEMSQKKDN